MRNPAQTMTDESLEKNLTDYVTGRMHEGDIDTVKSFIPNQSGSGIIQQIASRNILPKRVNWLIYNIEISVLGYLRALVQGFLYSDKQLVYVRPGAQVLAYPVFTPDETVACLSWLQQHAMTTFFQKRFKHIVLTELNVEAYRAMWDAAERDISQIPSGSIELTGIFQEPLPPPVWAAYQETSDLLIDPVFSLAGTRERANSVTRHLSKLSAARGRYLACDEKREEAFTRYGLHLQNKRQQLEREVEATRLQLRQQVTTAQNKFDQIPVGPSQQSDRREMSQPVIEFALNLCRRIANLEAEQSFIAQLEDMHKMQKTTAADKLRALIQSVEPLVGENISQADQIPVTTMSELRHHFAFLQEHILDYGRDLTKADLQRKGCVDQAGEMKSLSAADINRWAEAVAMEIKKRLSPWFVVLNRLNLVEDSRASCLVSLRELLSSLQKQLPKGNPRVPGGWLQSPGTVAAAAEEAWRDYQESCDQVTDFGSHSTADAMSRLEKLVELAPIQPHATIRNIEELLPLYEGTAVTQACLARLYREGLTNYTHLLRLAIERANRTIVLDLCDYLVSQGARVDSADPGEDYVGTEILAYAAIERELARDPRQLTLNWKLFALLRGVKQLFDSNLPAWLLQGVETILAVVSNKTGVAVASYRERDHALVQAIMRQLLLFVFIHKPNKQVLGESDWFCKLCGIWSYFSLCVQTSPEMLSRGAAPGDFNKLKKSLLAAVWGVFRQVDYLALRRRSDQLIRDQSLPVNEVAFYIDARARIERMEERASIQDQLTEIRSAFSRLRARASRPAENEEASEDGSIETPEDPPRTPSLSLSEYSD